MLGVAELGASLIEIVDPWKAVVGGMKGLRCGMNGPPAWTRCWRGACDPSGP
jgi:hypothetical protein